MNIWYYKFEDGEEYSLIGTGFSPNDVSAFEKRHGKCIDSGCKRINVRREYVVLSEDVKEYMA